MIYRDGDSWGATMLAPGNSDAGPGSLREAYVKYFLVCHNLNFPKHVVFDEDVASLSYPASLVDEAGEQIKLGAPIDIADDYRSITFENFKLDGKDLAAHKTKVRIQGIYKNIGELETLLRSGVEVAMAREYGGNNGIPLLTDNATRPVRRYFLERGDNPSRPLACPITILARADTCTPKYSFISKDQPCLVVEDGK